MKAYIYKPTKNAMQSGYAGTKQWILEFDEESRKFVEPLMGWTGSRDTKQQLRLRFDSKEDAIRYAKQKNIQAEIKEPKSRTIHPKAYASNFAFTRKTYFEDPNQPQ